MNTNTLEEQLHIVSGYIKKRFANRYEDLDDLVQEAKISAWKDFQKGMDSPLICSRAKWRVLGLISENSQGQYTGHIECSEGLERETQSGREARDKIRAYVDSYTKLHDHKPSASEIAGAMGVSIPTVQHHLNRLYTFHNQAKYSEQTLDSTFIQGDGEYSVANSMRFGYSFESQLVDRLDTWALVKTLEEKERTWVFLRIFEEKTNREIADLYGCSSGLVSLRVRQSMTRMRENAKL